MDLASLVLQERRHALTWCAAEMPSSSLEGLLAAHQGRVTHDLRQVCVLNRSYKSVIAVRRSCVLSNRKLVTLQNVSEMLITKGRSKHR